MEVPLCMQSRLKKTIECKYTDLTPNTNLDCILALIKELMYVDLVLKFVLDSDIEHLNLVNK